MGSQIWSSQATGQVSQVKSQAPRWGLLWAILGHSMLFAIFCAILGYIRLHLGMFLGHLRLFYSNFSTLEQPRGAQASYFLIKSSQTTGSKMLVKSSHWHINLVKSSLNSSHRLTDMVKSSLKSSHRLTNLVKSSLNSSHKLTDLVKSSLKSSLRLTDSVNSSNDQVKSGQNLVKSSSQVIKSSGLRHTSRYSICSPFTPILKWLLFRPKIYVWYLVWVIIWINRHMNAKKCRSSRVCWICNVNV